MPVLKRVKAILQHPFFLACLERNRQWEQERPFCRHDLGHLLDVARIAYAMALENRGFSLFAREIGHSKRGGRTKEVVYAAALLHDIGRWRQYENGADHARAGGEMCRAVLRECGFTLPEIGVVADAICHHRQKQPVTGDKFLSRILARADVFSRLCFCCPVAGECHRQGTLPDGLEY
ncbi:MAG: HD domain-containing protein [Heliobacteriaceae bacterium]|nr:HD domain-containing protein [Heliobacteriaceae bacterium]